MLYGFHKDPPLDVVTSWSETHKTTLFSRNHKASLLALICCLFSSLLVLVDSVNFLVQQEWIYFLNEGSQVNVSYDVNSPSSSSLVFVIAQGKSILLKRSSFVGFFLL